MAKKKKKQKRDRSKPPEWWKQAMIQMNCEAYERRLPILTQLEAVDQQILQLRASIDDLWAQKECKRPHLDAQPLRAEQIHFPKEPKVFGSATLARLMGVKK